MVWVLSFKEGGIAVRAQEHRGKVGPPGIEPVAWRDLRGPRRRFEHGFHGGHRLAQQGFSRLPLHGAALARHTCLRAEVARRELSVDLEVSKDPDDEDPTPSVEERMNQRPEPEIVQRAEDLTPEVKAQLRALIETYREASLVYFSVDSNGTQLILEGVLSQEGRPRAYFVESALLDPGEPLGHLVDEFMRDDTAFLR